MNVNQNYALVNLAAKEVFGESAIMVRNVKDLADLGEFVSSAPQRFEQFHQKINDVIIRTEIDTMLFELTEIPFITTTSEYGGYIREIYIGMPEAERNTSWDVGKNDYTPAYMPVKKLPVSVKIYSNKGTHRFEYTIPDDLLKSAFHSAEELDAYITGIGVAVENAIKLNAIEIARLVRCDFIAHKAVAENANTAVNLLTKYKAVNQSSQLTASTCIYDKDFLRFAAELMSRYPKKLGKPTALYSDELTEDDEQYVRQTTSDHLVFEIVEDFASKVKYNLQSDVYHKELVALPKYNEIDFWQGAGTGDDYADHTTIKVNIGTAEDPNEVVLTGVVALAYDDRAIRMYYNEPVSSADRNNRDRYTNYVADSNYGYAIKMSHNAVVFYIANTDWSFSGGVTITPASRTATVDGKAVSSLNGNLNGEQSYEIGQVTIGQTTYPNSVIGSVPYVTGFTGYSETVSEQSGNYVVLHIESVNEDAKLYAYYDDDVMEPREVDSNGNVAVRIYSDEEGYDSIKVDEVIGSKTNTYNVPIFATVIGSSDSIAVEPAELTTGLLTFMDFEATETEPDGTDLSLVTIGDLYGAGGVTIADSTITAEFGGDYLNTNQYAYLALAPDGRYFGTYGGGSDVIALVSADGTTWREALVHTGTLSVDTGETIEEEDCVVVSLETELETDTRVLKDSYIKFRSYGDMLESSTYNLSGFTIGAVTPSGGETPTVGG